jgi:hypothetical protein
MTLNNLKISLKTQNNSNSKTFSSLDMSSQVMGMPGNTFVELSSSNETH